MRVILCESQKCSHTWHLVQDLIQGAAELGGHMRQGLVLRQHLIWTVLFEVTLSLTDTAH